MNTNVIFILAAVLSIAGVTSGCAKWNNDKAVVAATGTSAGASGSTALAVDAARLTWTAPTQNSDNSALTDLAGYKVKYCMGACSGGPYGTTVNVGNVSTHTLTGLASGTYYFVVVAYDTVGNDSTNSSEVSKVIP
jgi:hypothetical protein